MSAISYNRNVQTRYEAAQLVANAARGVTAKPADMAMATFVFAVICGSIGVFAAIWSIV